MEWNERNNWIVGWLEWESLWVIGRWPISAEEQQFNLIIHSIEFFSSLVYLFLPHACKKASNWTKVIKEKRIKLKENKKVIKGREERAGMGLSWGTKHITNHSVFKNLWFLWRRQLSWAIQPIFSSHNSIPSTIHLLPFPFQQYEFSWFHSNVTWN